MDTGMIMIDLQKAFGVLDHNKILLEKMTCLGFKTPAIKWFKTYLSNKEFFVFPNDVFSEVKLWHPSEIYFGTAPVFAILMISLNHYQKVALIFMLLIRVF